MGEVYRARDIQLGRDVAIKTLSEGFSGQAEHLKRFEREAQPRALFRGNFVSTTLYRWYDVFPDGEHFLMLQPAEPNEIVFVANSFEELERLVPTESQN